MDSTNSPQSLEQSGAIGGTTAGQQQAVFGQAGAKQTLIAYHGDHAVKLKYVGRMLAHQEADEIIHMIYWKGGKGCAVGCTVHSSDHSAYETELGMPKWFARLEDMIFEGMSNAASSRFPLRLLSTIPVGFAAWDRLYHDFCAFLLRDVCKFDRTEHPDVATAVDAVINLHERQTETGDQAWKAAESAAWAAEWATRSAAWSAGSAWSAARSAAWAAGSAGSAARAADSAALSAGSAAWSATWSASYDRMADWLVRKFAASSGSD